LSNAVKFVKTGQKIQVLLAFVKRTNERMSRHELVENYVQSFYGADFFEDDLGVVGEERKAEDWTRE